MCLNKKTDTPEPRLPVEYAQQRAPIDTTSAETRTRDRLRASASTMLTGPMGVGAIDTSGKKVLLGG